MKRASNIVGWKWHSYLNSNTLEINRNIMKHSKNLIGKILPNNLFTIKYTPYFF